MDKFEQIVLNRSEIKDLHKAYRGKLYFCCMTPTNALINCELLDVKPGKNNPGVAAAKISEKGRRYVLYTRRKRIDKWVPILMSAIAIVISIIALIKQ